MRGRLGLRLPLYDTEGDQCQPKCTSELNPTETAISFGSLGGIGAPLVIWDLDGLEETILRHSGAARMSLESTKRRRFIPILFRAID